MTNCGKETGESRVAQKIAFSKGEYCVRCFHEKKEGTTNDLDVNELSLSLTYLL